MVMKSMKKNMRALTAWDAKALTAQAAKALTARAAVFAGSFDPFTLGHLDIVTRGSKLFDKVWVVVAENSEKKHCFDSLVKATVEKLPNVEVAIHEGLTVDFMKAVGANFLLRGIRSAADLDMEQSLAWNNKMLFEGAETVCLLSAPEHLAISSTAVREILASSKKTTAGQPILNKRSAKAGLADKRLVNELSMDKLLAKFVPAETIALLEKEFGKRK